MWKKNEPVSTEKKLKIDTNEITIGQLQKVNQIIFEQLYQNRQHITDECIVCVQWKLLKKPFGSLISKN